ncbi:amidase [Burkholderiales bacterium]|nr:amidase [Burkholderiales bacterium]
MIELHARGVRDLAPELASGALSVSELVAALIARIDATDEGVRAWAHLDRDRALAEAARLDALPVASRGAAFGLPLGVKDIIDTAGLPTQLGSPVGAGRRPSQDATSVARWRAAGGLVLGKTVTTEFAYMHPGGTANPWNPRHTPGGSSSGSAAAVALGQAPAAIGTQTNGSMIRPAAYCGVVGFKPTLDLVPFGGVAVFSPTLDTIGTFTRSVADAAIVAHALAPSIPRDVAPLARAPRLAFVDRFPWTQAVDDGGALDAAAARWRATGADLVAVALPDALERARDVHRTIMLGEAARSMGALQDRERARLSATLNAGLDEGRAIDDGALAKAHVARLAMIAAATAWLASYDALVAPPVPGPAPEGLGATGDPSCCTLASLLGFPAISLPAGRAPNGLPVGAQLVAAAGSDAALLSAAAWCESALPRWQGLI